MLDDLKVIHERDTQDALGVIEKQWQQYEHDFGFSWQPPREIFDVVIAGMGGSGLAAKFLQSWPKLAVPVTIVQNYELPDYVHENTLLICSSYSGNTEEVLSVLEEATSEHRGEGDRPMIVAIAAGGKLLEQATTHQLPNIVLPSGFQPRMTLGYQLRALLEVLEQTSLLDGSIAELPSAASWMKEQSHTLLATVPTSKNPAKQLALELMGKSPVIYAGPKFAPVAYKWKINFNENAKHIAWCAALPEFNHNEFVGWTGQPVDKPYAVIDLRSHFEHDRVQKRFEVSERLLSGQRPAAHVVEAQGESLLAQLLWMVQLGDFVSVYLALLNNIDPTPVAMVEKFKVAMNE